MFFFAPNSDRLSCHASLTMVAAPTKGRSPNSPGNTADPPGGIRLESGAFPGVAREREKCFQWVLTHGGPGG